MGKSAMVIINPSSGKEKAAEYEDRIKEVLQANYDEIEIQHTEGKGDATRFAQDAGRRGFDLVVSLGCDGTVNETINGLATQDNPPTLGIIPMGTVNDFARAMGIPLVPEEAIDFLGSAEARRVDIGKVNDHYFSNIVAVGNIAEAIHNVESEEKSRFGPFAYLIASVKELADGSTFEVDLEIDGKNWTGEVSQLAIALTSSLGGFNIVFPDAKIDDGLLHGMAIKKLDLAEAVKLTPTIIAGQLSESDNVEYFTAKTVIVKEGAESKIGSDIDGEQGPKLPLEIKVMPGHLKVLSGG